MVSFKPMGPFAPVRCSLEDKRLLRVKAGHVPNGLSMPYAPSREAPGAVGS